MSCYQCGSENGTETRLCPNCNKDRLEGQGRSPVQGESLRKPESNLLLILLVTCGGLLTVCVIAYVFLTAKAGKPSIAELEAPMRAYLLEGGNCSTGRFLESFRIHKVGSLDKHSGGYPVFTEHAIVCRSGNSTYTNRSDADDKVVTAWARYGVGGQIEIFIPEFFKKFMKQAEKEMGRDMEIFNQQIGKAFDKFESDIKQRR